MEIKEPEVILHDQERYPIQELVDLLDLGVENIRLRNGDELSLGDIKLLMTLPLEAENRKELKTLLETKSRELLKIKRILTLKQVQNALWYIDEFVCCMLAFRYNLKKSLNPEQDIQ